MPEQQNPEHQLEHLKELRKKYEAVLADAQKSGDYSEATKLKDELEQRLTALEALFPKAEVKPESAENEEFNEAEFEKKTIGILEEYLTRGLISSEQVLRNLTAMSSRESMDLRTKAYNLRVLETQNKEIGDSLMLLSFTGVDNELAWNYRVMHPNFSYILKSLAGIDSDRAWEWRGSRIKVSNSSSGLAQTLAISVTGIDSERAWKFRADLYGKNILNTTVIRELLNSLAGIDTEDAWESRDEFNTSVENLPYLINSVTGIDNEKAWEYRDSFKLQLDAGVFDNDFLVNESILARSLAGIDSERAWEMRREWIINQNYKFLAESLAGLNNDRAWAMRSSLEKEAAKGFLVNYDLALSLNGDPTTAIGWRTAKKYQKQQSQP